MKIEKMQQHTSLAVCSSLSQLETRQGDNDLSGCLSAPPLTRHPQLKNKRLMRRQLSAPVRFQAIHNKLPEPRYNVINNHLSHVQGPAPKRVKTLALVRFTFHKKNFAKALFMKQPVC